MHFFRKKEMIKVAPQSPLRRLEVERGSKAHSPGQTGDGAARMFADFRGLRELRAGAPRALQALIFHDDAFVECMSAPGADPDTFKECKVTWCGSNAWNNHERCAPARLQCVPLPCRALSRACARAPAFLD